jgi:hypothetical protein
LSAAKAKTDWRRSPYRALGIAFPRRILIAALRRGRVSRLAPTANSGQSAGQFDIRNTGVNGFKGEATT